MKMISKCNQATKSLDVHDDQNDVNAGGDDDDDDDDDDNTNNKMMMMMMTKCKQAAESFEC